MQARTNAGLIARASGCHRSSAWLSDAAALFVCSQGVAQPRVRPRPYPWLTVLQTLLDPRLLAHQERNRMGTPYHRLLAKGHGDFVKFRPPQSPSMWRRSRRLPIRGRMLARSRAVIVGSKI